jgi:hypothetical protein
VGVAMSYLSSERFYISIIPAQSGSIGRPRHGEQGLGPILGQSRQGVGPRDFNPVSAVPSGLFVSLRPNPGLRPGLSSGRAVQISEKASLLEQLVS